MVEHFDRNTPCAELTKALARDGATVVDDFLDGSQVDALVADFRPHLDGVSWCNMGPDDLVHDFFGRRTKRLHGLLARSKHFGSLITEPLMLDLCEHFLSANCREYRISTGELMALGSSETQQPLHRDADSWYSFPPPRPEILVSANFALTEFRADNGATVVVPGSHRWPRDRKPKKSEEESAVMSRGSVLLYTGDILHGGGENRTEEVRIGLYLGYILSWLRPIENHAVSNGLDVLRKAPPRVQRLLDFVEGGFDALA